MELTEVLPSPRNYPVNSEEHAIVVSQGKNYPHFTLHPHFREPTTKEEWVVFILCRIVDHIPLAEDLIPTFIPSFADDASCQQQLHTMAQVLEVPQVLQEPLYNDRFLTYPGSTSKHHAYKGGLLRHTWEVSTIASYLCQCLRVDAYTVYLATLWHDYGKIYDYEPYQDGYVNTSHKYKIHHIHRSFAEFMCASKDTDTSSELHEEIGHAILAHHGIKSWGSQITPHTPEAWLVHLADLFSVQVITTRNA